MRAEPTDDPRFIIEVDHEPTYVLGYPIMVRVTVRPAGAHAVDVHAESEFEHFFTSVRLVDPASGREQLAFPAPVPTVVGRPERLDRGQRQTFLADLSDDVPAEMPGGRYQATVRFHAALSAPFELELRRPTGSERARIDALKADIGRFTTWGAWAHESARRWTPLGAVAPSDPARFYIVYRYLLWGAEAAADVPTSYPDVLDDRIHADAAEVLRVDLAFARGDAARARAELDRVRRERPEVSWQLDRIERTGSRIAMSRGPERKVYPLHGDAAPSRSVLRPGRRRGS